MRVATNLSELQGLGRYSLHPDNDDTRFLQQAIGRLLPHTQFDGFVEKLSKDQDTVITVDSRWREALKRGSMPKDLVVFPATDVVGWEFWHFGRQVIDRCVPGSPAVLAHGRFHRLPFTLGAACRQGGWGRSNTLLAGDDTTPRR